MSDDILDMPDDGAARMLLAIRLAMTPDDLLTLLDGGSVRGDRLDPDWLPVYDHILETEQ